jgi:hypothetical protein
MTDPASEEAMCGHCGRQGAEAYSGPGIYARRGTPLCHPSDTSLPDCYRRVGVWAEPVGALLGYDVKPAGVEAYRQYRASLPHDPMWNLIPRRNQAVPWECSWHGTISAVTCAECHREHAEYLDHGTWS